VKISRGDRWQCVVNANETKIKILCAVLQLERFTIADLCLHTGLQPPQVYREIADLQNRELLSSSTLVKPGEALPPHRARKLYRLNPEPENRAALQEEVNQFLPAGFNLGVSSVSSAHLEKAQQTLSWLTEQVLGASSASLRDENLERWQTELQARFEEAGQALTRATWESELDFSEQGTSNHPIAVATRLHRTLSERFAELIRTERARRERAAAAADWSKALPRIAREALKIAVPAAAALSLPSAISAVVAAVAVGEMYKMLRRQPEKGRFEGSLYEQKLQSLGASLQRDLSYAGTKSDVLAALAKHFIAYGGNAGAPLKCLRQLNRETERNARLQFDQANLALLQNNIDEAHGCWIAYRNLQRAPALPSLISKMAASSWSDSAYHDAVREINKRYAASVTALSQTPFSAQDAQSIGPRLFNPLYGKSDREPEYIPISENFGADLSMHVAGSGGELIIDPGVPKLICADLLCESGLDIELAWKTAMSVEPDERIINVEFVQRADDKLRHETQHILQDHFPDAVAFA
jgi:hypothetical protein